MSRQCLMLALCGMMIGCAGARFNLKADTAQYPISLSPALLDENGAVLHLGEELESVGELSERATHVGVFYSATGRTWDISRLVNAAVQEHGGEGIVGLQVITKNCGTNWLFPLTIIPLWPGCIRGELSGLVVVRRKQPADALIKTTEALP